MPVVYLAARLLWIIRWFGVGKLPLCKRALIKAKVFPIGSHYHEPAFAFDYLSKPLDEPRGLPGVDLDLKGQLELLKSFGFQDELRSTPLEKEKEGEFYLHNGFFEGGEAEIWYSMIRHFKPKRIFEIGSGFSTLLAIKAIRRNTLEDSSYGCHHVCIEPFEKPWLEELGVDLIREKVECMSPDFFSCLSENDFLFIDSSHVIRPQGDILFEYQQILPRLKRGVIVHIHDIYTPMDYPRSWIVDQVMFWNEQYLVEIMLSASKEWKLLLTCYYLFKTEYPALEACCPLLTRMSEPGSLYIQKV
jgi:hypothetical protein